MARVLIVDDNQGVLDALSLMLELDGLEAVTAGAPAQALEQVRKGGVDLVIQDMNFSADTTTGDEGESLFAELRDLDPDLPIILLTAWTHLEQAVALVRRGAADYLAKPWDDEKLLVTVHNLLDLRRERRENNERRATLRSERDKLAARYELCGMVYASHAMHEAARMATRVAPSDLPVLITGPNGAGKQKIAEIIQANSAVADGPFVTVNAGALPENLLEAELFGAEAGAYTGANKARQGRFEVADGGTLFLDEIANLSAEGQAKLLRVLQTGEFERLGSSRTLKSKARVLSATNADLETLVADGKFREDLYYRLNVITIDVPPLRERRADVLPLARHFLDDECELSMEAEAALTRYDWPGNVRELENCIKRACVLADARRLQVTDLGLTEAGASPEDSAQAVRDALQEAGGVVARAARSLNLSRQAFYRRMEKYGIEP